MAGLFSSLFSGAASTMIAEAIKEMPAVVAGIYSTVKGILPAAPTSSAEVGIAAALLKELPSLTQAQLAAIKTVYGKAVAEYVTQKPNANLGDATVWTEIQALADSGVSSTLGLDTAKISTVIKAQLLTSAIIVFQAGMGVSAIDVTKS